MKKDTVSSPLTETQKREPGGSSTRMENLAKIEPHGQEPDSEKKRTEIKTINSSLTEAQHYRMIHTRNRDESIAL